LGTSKGVYHVFASVNGYAALTDTAGDYWTLSGENIVVQGQVTLGPTMAFGIVPVPSLVAVSQQFDPSLAVPAITACEVAVASLVWHVTGGLFLALGIGPYVGSGTVAPGIIGVIKSTPAGTQALSALLAGAKSNPENVVALTAVSLGAIYEAGLLWKVSMFLLSWLGWVALFQVLAKILEWILLPEVEVAVLLASFVVWTAQAILAARQVGADCVS
jgi:hypothetical protein